MNRVRCWEYTIKYSSLEFETVDDRMDEFGYAHTSAYYFMNLVERLLTPEVWEYDDDYTSYN
jgi:hypothetical protein